MPTSKSAAKRVRYAERRRLRNKAAKTRIKNLRDQLLAAVAKTDKEAAEKICREYFSFLDKCAKKGIIKKQAADRRKQRASMHLNKLLAASA